MFLGVKHGAKGAKLLFDHERMLTIEHAASIDANGLAVEITADARLLDPHAPNVFLKKDPDGNITAIATMHEKDGKLDWPAPDKEA